MDNPKCKRIVLECSDVMRTLQRRAKELGYAYRLPLKPAEKRLEEILSSACEYESQVDLETKSSLLKMMQRAAGFYDSNYIVIFPSDNYEDMCTAVIRTALLSNNCPEWIYDDSSDMLPTSRSFKLLAIYCLKRVNRNIDADWATLYSRYKSHLMY